jgi:serine protease
LIDAFMALQEANLLDSGGLLPAVLNVSPSALNFGTTLTDLTLTVSNGGDSPLQIGAVTETAFWYTVVEESVDPVIKLGTYRASIAVDRATLNDAAYITTITFVTDTAGTIEVPVTMQVRSAGAADYDAGFHYILLIDPDTNNTLHVLNTASMAGIYRFNFTNIAAGDYYVVAGTDSDNDNYICGPGEACGGYPTLDQLAPVTVNNENIIGIDFITGFSVNLSSAAATAAHIPAAGFAIETRQKTINASD